MLAHRQHQSPSEDEITICAYLIWQHEGQPEGRDKVHWHKAEMQLPVSHAHDRELFAKDWKA